MAAEAPTLTSMLKKAAADFPSRVAVAVPGKLELKHAALDELVDAVAARLVADAGVLPGHVVALSFPNTVELVITVLAVLRVRGVAAPLDPAYTQEEFESCLSGSEARLLITSAEANAAAQAAAAKLGPPLVHVAATLQDAAGPVHFAGLPAESRTGNGNGSKDSGFSANNNDMSDVALLLHTLNTECRPMGLPLTQGTLAASVQNMRSVYRLVETDATVVVLPLFHAHGLVCGLLSSLASGASVSLPAAGRFSASTFWDDMRESGATWYIGEPTIHQTILDRYAREPEAPYRALRFISTYDPSLELAIQGRLLAAFGAPVVLQAHRMLEASHLMTSVIIVGAGPSGLSVAACLREKSVPFMVLERDDCIAPLWQKQTYDGLKLHLPKRFYELPRVAFHDHYPEYPTSCQYVDYLKFYAAKFEINPEFNTTVLSARYDETSGLWRVRVRATDTGVGGMEYIARWLVVTTGENAQSVVPNIPGLDSFTGEVTHVGDYNSGQAYRGKSVLVVGSGNSGMEVALDLFNHGARPAVVARNGVHVLPREVFGKPTLELASMLLEDWRLPLWAVDKVMALLARVVLGDLAKLGLRRPADGPLERKGTRVRTPVFDCGALERIRAGDIAVFPAVARFGRDKVEFVNGRALDIDAVVLATGRRSNMPQAKWHGDRNGYPAIAFPYSWDGYCGLYTVGFSRRSFGGSSTDAVRVAEDIGGAWRAWREGTEPAADSEGAVIVF